MKPRNLFTTKTIQGAFGMLAGFAVTTSPLVDMAVPSINSFIDRKVKPEQAEDFKFYLGLVVILGSFARTVYGRHLATADVFTPGLLPGRSKKEIEDATN